MSDASCNRVRTRRPPRRHRHRARLRHALSPCARRLRLGCTAPCAAPSSASTRCALLALHTSLGTTRLAPTHQTSLGDMWQVLFSLALTGRVLHADRELDEDEWSFLLAGGDAIAPAGSGGGGGGDALREPLDNSPPEWLSDKAWGDVCHLSQLAAFRSLPDSIIADPAEWRKWHGAKEPHAIAPPAAIDVVPPPSAAAPAESATAVEVETSSADVAGGELAPSGVPRHVRRRRLKSNQGGWTAMQRLLLLRCLRPDKCVPAVSAFVAEQLGSEYIDPPLLDLEASYDESTPSTPIIFVLSHGAADPITQVHHLPASPRISPHLPTPSCDDLRRPSLTFAPIRPDRSALCLCQRARHKRQDPLHLPWAGAGAARRADGNRRPQEGRRVGPPPKLPPRPQLDVGARAHLRRGRLPRGPPKGIPPMANLRAFPRLPRLGAAPRRQAHQRAAAWPACESARFVPAAYRQRL